MTLSSTPRASPTPGECGEMTSSDPGGGEGARRWCVVLRGGLEGGQAAGLPFGGSEALGWGPAGGAIDDLVELAAVEPDAAAARAVVDLDPVALGDRQRSGVAGGAVHR